MLGTLCLTLVLYSTPAPCPYSGECGLENIKPDPSGVPSTKRQVGWYFPAFEGGPFEPPTWHGPYDTLVDCWNSLLTVELANGIESDGCILMPLLPPPLNLEE